MKATNTLARKPEAPKSFTGFMQSEMAQTMMRNILHDDKRSASLASTLISVVNSSAQLASCSHASILSAALRGEGMGLSAALGQYSIVPYGDKAQFQLSYKGWAQLAQRSGRYVDFGVFDVREGEYKGKDRRTRQPVIEWLDDEIRESVPLSGFYGFYELDNGFFKSVYWTHEKILNHADRYSKAFKKEMYDKLIAGKLSEAEATKLRSGSPWYDDPLSEAHMKMCKKTVLIQMLGDGSAPLSLDMQVEIDKEKELENHGAIIYPSDPEVVAANAKKEEEDIVDVEAVEKETE